MALSKSSHASMSNTTDSEEGTDTSTSMDGQLPEGVPMVAFGLHLPGGENIAHSPSHLPAIVGIRPALGGDVSYYQRVATSAGGFPRPLLRPPMVVPSVVGGSTVAAAPLVQSSPVLSQQPGEPPSTVETTSKPPEKSDAGETSISPENASPVSQSTVSMALGGSMGSAVAAAPLVQASQVTSQPLVESRLSGNSPVPPSTTGELIHTESVSVLGAAAEIQTVATPPASPEKSAPAQAERGADQEETGMEVSPVTEPSGPSYLADPLGSVRAGMSGVGSQEVKEEDSPASPKLSVRDKLRSLAIGRGSAPCGSGGNMLASALPAGAESELGTGLELMDSSMQTSDLPASSETPTEVSTKRKRPCKTPERRKRAKDRQRDIKRGVAPPTRYQCPVCTSGPGVNHHQDYSFCRHIVSCLMHQMYFCPVRGCHAVVKRADYLQAHLRSQRHQAAFQDKLAGAFLDRCRITVDTDVRHRQVRVIPPSPDYKECLNSLACTQRWLKEHAGRSTLDVVLGWEGVKGKLADEALSFTLVDPGVWEAPPREPPARATPQKKETKAVPASAEVKMEMGEEGAGAPESEEGVSSSSST